LWWRVVVLGERFDDVSGFVNAPPLTNTRSSTSIIARSVDLTCYRAAFAIFCAACHLMAAAEFEGGERLRFRFLFLLKKRVFRHFRKRFSILCSGGITVFAGVSRAKDEAVS